MNDPLSPKEHKNFDAMMKRLRSSVARQTFYPSFSFPTRETMDAAIDGMKERRIENVNFGACALGATKTIWFAERMAELSLKTLTIDTNAVGQSGAAAIFKGLPETEIETLSIANNNLSGKVGGAILRGLAASKLVSLDVTNNPLGNGFVKGLADVLKTKKDGTSDAVPHRNDRQRGGSARRCPARIGIEIPERFPKQAVVRGHPKACFKTSRNFPARN